MDAFNTLAQSNNPAIAILASLVLVLFGVIVWQNNYNNNKTVPKWLFDKLADNVEDLVKNAIPSSKVDQILQNTEVLKAMAERGRK